MPCFARAATIAGAALLLGSPALHAQRGGTDWTTIGNDAQRSNWLRGDGRITPDVMTKPGGFDMLWKAKFNNTARQMNSITPPALIDYYIGYRGFRTLGFFGGSSDTVIAVDTDLARIEWEKKTGSGAPSAPATVQCPGGMTSSVARITAISYPPSGFGRGRGNPAASGVGEPGEGAVTLKARPPQPAPPPPPPAAAKTGRRQTAPVNVYSPRVQYVYSVSGDGKLHLMYISNGEEPNAAIPFLPANAHARGLMVFDNIAYVATVNGCGGVDNGIWALDLETKKVSQWKSASGNVAGTQGFAVGPDGMIFVAAGNELVALDSEALTQKGTYKTGGAAFTSSPLVFEFKGKNVIAASTADGKVHLVDAAGMTSVGSGDAGMGDYAVGALTSWQDAGGARWILAPSTSKVTALKVTDSGLDKGWTSRDMVQPISPIVVNGVVFAVSAGKRGTPAVLYALDAATGKDVWNSGKSMISFVTTGGMSAGGGRVYVSTHDGIQYAFGIPMEH